MGFEQVQLSDWSARVRATCQRSSATNRASSRAKESSSSLYWPSVILLRTHDGYHATLGSDRRDGQPDEDAETVMSSIYEELDEDARSK